ncbi:MAG: alpha/beta hydrolase [Rickettsiaceae bacterium]|nr:alpha/beta hydrolase [Rickettsiaceae bacterium]
MADVFFNGPAGRIEGKYFQSSNEKAPVALVLHPHPLYGGSMNNKVVYAVYKSLLQLDMSVLRINFRGVGKSQGEYDGGVGELTDAATALDWLQLKNPIANQFWIAGFSFGSWIALQLIMRRPEINNFIAISPPVNKFDFSFLSPCPVPGLIIQGNQDSIVDENAVMSVAEKLSKQKIKVDYKTIDGADHFFRNKITELEETIADYVRTLQKGTSQTHQGAKSRSAKKMSQMLLS